MIVKGGIVAALAPKPGPIDGRVPPISDHGGSSHSSEDARPRVHASEPAGSVSATERDELSRRPGNGAARRCPEVQAIPAEEVEPGGKLQGRIEQIVVEVVLFVPEGRAALTPPGPSRDESSTGCWNTAEATWWLDRGAWPRTRERSAPPEWRKVEDQRIRSEAIFIFASVPAIRWPSVLIAALYRSVNRARDQDEGIFSFGFPGVRLQPSILYFEENVIRPAKGRGRPVPRTGTYRPRSPSRRRRGPP